MHTLTRFLHRMRAAGACSLGALALLGASLADAAPDAAPAAQSQIVTLDTSEGAIVLELDAAHAPRTVANFVQYLKSGHYDGTIFHRVIPGFMIQGGGFTAAMEEKSTRSPIVNEGDNGLKNLRGTIAMARRPPPDSATAQFFINVADNGALDSIPGRPGYAVFGKVLAGMEIVDKIVAAPTTRKGMFADVPVTPVVIKSARLGR